MIRTLLFVSLLTSSIVSPNAQAEVTAEEVALHLGIQFLKIPAKHLPESFDLQLVEVREGQVYEEPHVGPVAEMSFTERPANGLTLSSSINDEGKFRVVIAAHPQGAPIRATLDRPQPRGISTFRTEIQQAPTDQPILLYAQEKSRIDGMPLIPEKLDDVHWGVAIIIRKRSATAASKQASD